MTPQDGQTIGPMVGIGVAVAVILFRMRNAKARPLSVVTMWIVPALLLAMMVGVTFVSHLGTIDYLWVVLLFALGGALGWQRGRLMPIHVDPETGRPMVKTSPAALIFIVALMAVRFVGRSFLESHATDWHINPMLVSDCFLAFAVGLLGVARVEMFIRARRLVGEHHSAGKLVV